ncbi:DUF3054 domain-containing protein [Arsenicicoccus dermatophilus]|uniref:DUF3054 domain-containing protein n=1 Tax=Arsenicicoccus dermatophilus TaxID=1076331 RepID=UPI001F4D2D57|nr:DUF3054 domain-containing protein [Arsenicicoccus dermatophilus]MCH8612502.1 DUF3054 domain-containing protein [Arsenicicoccus dermatophilus]
MRLPLFLLLDLVLVVVFSALGRRSHAEAVSLAGLLTTAWPFLVGVLVGWAGVLASRLPATSLRGGLPIWLTTVVVGMLLRVLTGAGTAFAFVLVAFTVLAIFLLLPRLIAQRSHHHPPVPPHPHH